MLDQFFDLLFAHAVQKLDKTGPFCAVFNGLSANIYIMEIASGMGRAAF